MMNLGNIYRSVLSDYNPFHSPSYTIRPLHGNLIYCDFPTDVREKDAGYLIHAELPGLRKEDISITIEGDCLTISAKTEQYDQKSEDEKIIQSERYFGSISRMMKFPSKIEKKSSRAQYENGVLEIFLGKIKNKDSEKLEIN